MELEALQEYQIMMLQEKQAHSIKLAQRVDMIKVNILRLLQALRH